MPTTKGIFAGTVVFGLSPTNSVGIAVPGGADTVAVVLDLTSMTGTGSSIEFEVQWSMDGGTWASAEPRDSFAPLSTAPASVAKRFDVKAPYFRASITVTGADSPSFTGTANAYL
jgi:hypothetical protein